MNIGLCVDAYLVSVNALRSKISKFSFWGLHCFCSQHVTSINRHHIHIYYPYSTLDLKLYVILWVILGYQNSKRKEKGRHLFYTDLMKVIQQGDSDIINLINMYIPMTID